VALGSGQMAAVNLIGSYNYSLVALSVFIAVFASYAALDLASRVTAAGGWTRALWVLGGACAMGTGIWSMHYIGMLAFILPIPVAYHWPTVLLSLFAAILASAIALYVVSRQKMGASQAVAGSVLMGAGIAGMHYIGMAAMRLPAVCQFNSSLVVLSVAFAVLISLAALWITFHFRDEKTGVGWKKLAGAVVMGAAIPVMHYTGMAAASFTPFGVPVDLSYAVSISALGIAGIVAVTFIVLGLALLTSWVDRRFAAQIFELQQQRSKAYLAEAQRLSHTGSFGWKPSTGEIIWSEETFRVFQYDRATTPTVELILQRVHPEDVTLVKQTIERATQDGKNFEHEYRLLMPDGSLKHVHVVARALGDESSVEFVGAVMDVTAAKRAEKTLRESEAYLAEAQSLSHTGSWARNSATGEMRYWSEECYRVLGFEPQGGLPRFETFLQRIHPDDRARVSEVTETAGREKVGYEVDYRIVHPGGEVREIHTVGHPVFNPSGDLIEFVGTVIDVTERKLAEALRNGERGVLEMIARDAPLEETLEKLVRTMEAQSAGLLCSVLLLDEDGQHVRRGAAPTLPKPYNDAIDGVSIGPKAGSCGTAMYRREPVVVTDILEDPLWEAYREVAKPYGLRACWSTPILAHSGKVLGSFAMYYREPRRPSPSENRALEMATHLAGIAIESKLTQERLQRSEAYLAEGQRLTHMGSWALNVDTRQALHSSAEHTRLFGFDPEKGMPSFEKFLERVHPEDLERVLETFQTSMRSGGDLDLRYRIAVPGGPVRYMHAIGHSVPKPSGAPGEYVGIAIDITERRRSDQERERLRQLEADLAHMNRVSMMGELTASLAHEVKQPIAAAVTDANTCVRWLSRDDPDVEEGREAASRVVKDATRAAEIISRVRHLFTKGTPERALIDVNEVIREMTMLLSSEATRYNVSVRMELAADLPQVMGDRVQLHQVLMNLMTNGIDAMRDLDGTRELIISSQAEDGHLTISVRDTGVGLPPKQADQIFDAFFTTKPQGTGMGLRISRSIVESHGGRLWAAANSPRGASFHLTLPIEAEAGE
jgi:PAS domain S-box-containing protein